MPGYLYLGESAGGRIIRTGVGVTQIGDPYQLELYTWDDRPLGDDGECIFRWLTAIVRHTMGYAIQVTPIVDGVPSNPSAFSGGAPPAGTEAVERLRSWPLKRGNRIAALVKTTQIFGPTELVDVQFGYTPIRTGR